MEDSQNDYLKEISAIKGEIDDLIKIFGIKQLLGHAVTIVEATQLQIHQLVIDCIHQVKLSVVRAEGYLANTDVSKARACISLGFDALEQLFSFFNSLFKGV